MDNNIKNSVLIVDDDKINLIILNSILGHEYTVYMANNGTAAIEIASENSPDLILLDIIMPDMNGFEVLSVLKKNEKTKKIPVIIITGLENDEDEEKGLDLEACDYIHKPFSAKIVKLKVRNQIQIVNQINAIEKYAHDMELAMSKMEAMVNNYKGVIWSVDKNGTITSFSGNYLSVIGIESSFLVGKNILATENLSSHSNIIENVKKSFSEGPQDWTSEIEGKSFRMHTMPMYNSEGSVIGLVGSADDVTELMKLQNELEAALKDAKTASKAKSSFLARMSHEIRTPLNAVIGISDIQLQNQTLSQDVKEAFIRISNSGDLLLGIINDILDISKIEAGKLEISPERYEVSSMISDTVSLNKIKYEEKPIEFILNIDENVPSELYGDEIRIKQILNNLLSNAFKYTSSGEVELSLNTENGVNQNEILMIFRVRDTGQGMTDDQLEKLFDEYARFNMETNRTTVGTGLGMGITQNLIHMMNGEILAESEKGKGTLFTVRFPQGSVDAPVLGKESVDKLRQFRSSFETKMNMVQLTREPIPFGKVLIVDDIEMNLYVAKGMLSQYGLHIDTAPGGAEAIEKIKKAQADNNIYDLVFMDHMMPVMDGIEATKKIRQLGPDFEKVPIIALTANAITGMKDKFLANGFNGYISKPINVQELDEILREWISPKKISETQNIKPATHVNDEKPEKDSKFNELFAESLKKINEINIETGLNYLANSMDTYRNTLELFYNRLETECNNMTASLNKKDTGNFLISVHAMKSMLAIIGASGLSDMARSLEIASSNQDIDYCEKNYGKFKTRLILLHKKLAVLFINEFGVSDVADDTAEDNTATHNAFARGAVTHAAVAHNAGNILVVDDIEMNLFIMKGKLERYKMKVDTAASGSTALEKIKNNAYNVIFMDYLMPEMDGIETTIKIRQWETENNSEKNIIIALTADEEPHVIEKFLNNGFNGFLAKPVITLELEKVLQNYCPLFKK